MANTAAVLGRSRKTALADGTPLVAVVAGMFGFAPPPIPQPAPTPCPHCQAREAIALYATALTAYFRCVQCRQVWTATPDRPQNAPGAAAA